MDPSLGRGNKVRVRTMDLDIIDSLAVFARLDALYGRLACRGANQLAGIEQYGGYPAALVDGIKGVLLGRTDRLFQRIEININGTCMFSRKRTRDGPVKRAGNPFRTGIN